MKVEPVTLEGQHVRLEPMAPSHAAALLAVSGHPELFRWMPFSLLSAREFEDFWKIVGKLVASGTALPLVTVARATNAVAGATGYWNIDLHNRRLEIGATWITPQYQRSGINTEAKYLMLRHAFETLGCMRVEFKTDALNEKSRTALLRIGAKEEGILRNHMLMPGGRKRNSVSFSVIDEEWPQVKARLEGMLTVGASGTGPAR